MRRSILGLTSTRLTILTTAHTTSLGLHKLGLFLTRARTRAGIVLLDSGLVYGHLLWSMVLLEDIHNKVRRVHFKNLVLIVWLIDGFLRQEVIKVVVYD